MTERKSLLKRARTGNRNSQYKLACSYDFDLPKDRRRAAYWYRKVAEQGHAEAQFRLGFAYRHGFHIPQDDAEAVKWFRKAAEQGVAKAQVMLGLMYAMGQGVPQDYVQAHMWSTLAAAQGSQGAAKIRDKPAERMTREQIAEAQRLAREWRPKATQ